MRLDRLSRIENYIMQQEHVSLENLAEKFQLSVNTARRDVIELEKRGCILRIRGGAMAKGPIRSPEEIDIYKNIWIEQFKKMSKLAYSEAELVTSLYEHARELQIELGCPKDITMVTPNGIDASRFLAPKDAKRTLETDMIHVGAVLRVTPIKDVKTLIRAFSFAKE